MMAVPWVLRSSESRKVFALFVVVDVGVMTGHGVVGRSVAILEDDMVRSDQAIPAVANFRASPQVDAIEPQRVGGLVSGAACNRQPDLWREREVSRGRSACETRPKSM